MKQGRGMGLAAAGLVWTMAAHAAGAAGRLSFAPVPAWVAVQPVPLDAVAPADGLSQGRHYLLVDDQVRVAGDTLADKGLLARRE